MRIWNQNSKLLPVFEYHFLEYSNMISVFYLRLSFESGPDLVLI